MVETVDPGISAADSEDFAEVSVPKTSFELIWRRPSASESPGGLGSARTDSVRLDDTKKAP